MPTPHRFPPSYTIEVIPSLPTVTIETTVAQSGHNSVASGESFGNTNISLYNGESTDCTLKITNTSNVAIEYLDLSIQVKIVEERGDRKCQIFSNQITKISNHRDVIGQYLDR